MNLKTFVKVGSITNLSDARYCAGFGVDMLGFCLDPESKDYISATSAAEIMGWIAGPTFVAECGNLDPESIHSLQAEQEIPYYQIDNIDTAAALSEEGKKVILRFLIESEDHAKDAFAKITNLSKSINYILIECTNPDFIGGINKSIVNTNIEIPIIQSFGVEKDQLQNILNNNYIKGIELKGSHEEQSGFKEYDELADILEALEAED